MRPRAGTSALTATGTVFSVPHSFTGNQKPFGSMIVLGTIFSQSWYRQWPANNVPQKICAEATSSPVDVLTIPLPKPVRTNGGVPGPWDACRVHLRPPMGIAVALQDVKAVV